ncbi:MAG TPA: cobyrinic acid a,c-diamide synthase [Desulfobulbaceae bacterium]|nr:cobyrinic acid a,c-diamide synthase [Desulfobulbaceae bacterium]
MSGNCRGIVVAGLSGGSGKSVAAVGLTAYLRGAGLRVVPFKKGPDYIDAGWLGRAAQHPCYNLDPFLMTPEAICSSFGRHAAGADVALVEGNRGLYDGVDAGGAFSTAELAVQLGLPVLLVVNCSKATRTVAAMVLGCREFDHRLRIAGVILNHIATARQERVIREAVERYTSIPVAGVLPRQGRDIFPMRHLGITPHQEAESVQLAIERLAGIVAEHFDTVMIRGLLAPVEVPAFPGASGGHAQRVAIGVLRDRAFQFYYEENLEALRAAGADLVMIDALSASALPEGLDGLYIGGGFPETSARELAANSGFRASVCSAAEQGLPIYAECGGLIFLGRSIVLEGAEYPLAGVFPVTFGMGKKPQAHGYSIFTADRDNPYYSPGTTIKGHEFRYSTVLQWDGKAEDLALRMERGTGFMGGRDGLVRNNVLALYTHVLAPGSPEWTEGIAAAARRYRAGKGNPVSGFRPSGS